MSLMFYCPNCGLEQKGLSGKDIPRGSVANIRDGYGYPIHHYKCPVCGNLDAGAMTFVEDDPGWADYVKSVIKIYQGVRGFEE